MINYGSDSLDKLMNEDNFYKVMVDGVYMETCDYYLSFVASLNYSVFKSIKNITKKITELSDNIDYYKSNPSKLKIKIAITKDEDFLNNKIKELKKLKSRKESLNNIIDILTLIDNNNNCLLAKKIYDKYFEDTVDNLVNDKVHLLYRFLLKNIEHA